MLKEIKHQFMAFRNGIVADALRKAGYNYNVIFGLQLPQLAEIARTQTPSLQLAGTLWEDDGVRESRLLACYLFPAEEVDKQLALSLASSVKTQEEGDILTFRLLRRLPFATELKTSLKERDEGDYVVKALERFDI